VAVFTSDRKFTVTLDINPNRSGTNVFTVSVVETGMGTSITNVGVSLYTTMLDMKMATGTIHLHPDGKGHFIAHGDLAMAGDWRIRIQIRTPDQRLYEATVNVLMPS
jgi:copper transport protein